VNTDTDTIDLENEPIAPVINPTTKRVYGDFSGNHQLHNNGIRALLAGENGVVRMAVEDVKALTAAGIVSKGHLAVTVMPRRICEGMTISQVNELLLFFKDENIGLLLRIGGIDVEPSRFRQKLGFDW
jgi:hypothetical protein